MEERLNELEVELTEVGELEMVEVAAGGEVKEDSNLESCNLRAASFSSKERSLRGGGRRRLMRWKWKAGREKGGGGGRKGGGGVRKG